MLSRRVFMKSGGLALVSLGLAPELPARAAAPARKVLVAIFQRGGADGLNMIVPFGERDYYAARPTIAIQMPGSGPGAALDLDGFFGMHPGMAPLAPLFAAGHMAVVHASGSTDPTRSHLDAQEYLESGTPGVKSTQDGWLNRCLHAREHGTATPFPAVALAPQLPRALQGSAPALAVGRLARAAIRGVRAVEDVQAAFEAEYAAGATGAPQETRRETLEALRMLHASNRARGAPANGAAYPSSPLGDSLKRIAQLIKADVGLEIAFAESGGWDHHANEGGASGQLATRLDDFARGIGALARDLGDRMSDVVILTMSEFGRAVAENGSRGTDHGHGNAMLVIGGAVRGGKVYGRWPGLAREQRHEGRDLAVTTDFRTVFAEITRAHLGLHDSGSVFPGFETPGNLGLMR